jgi:glucan 1,3-beta-glucosidase
MVPSLATCAAGKRDSELDVAKGWGSHGNARAVLERHWDTFITRNDFQYLASIGINTVRLPIGYWSLGPDFCQGTDFEPVADVYQNSWPRVIRAISWAAEYGIGVLVDLHGAPGSQNGQSHSGISDGRANLFKDPYNIGKTMKILVHLAGQLSGVTNVVGIQLLNEPVNDPDLASFCMLFCSCSLCHSKVISDDQAISAIRGISPQAAALPIYIHDGFDLKRFSDYVSARTDFVVQDHHSYFVFTPQDSAKPAKQHAIDIKTGTNKALGEAATRQHRNLMVGEWSCALTEQSLANEDDRDESRRRFCSGQMEVYTNTTAGWAFWCELQIQSIWGFIGD